MKSPNLSWPDPSSIPDLSPHQREQLAKATTGPMCCLTGVPGAGKTYTVAAVTRALIHRHGASSICFAAPTGKAAKQIERALQKYRINIPAATIHRTLGVQRAGYDGKGWGFVHNSRNTLPYKFYFLDEASMLSTSLGESFITAIPSGSHVMLIGDTGQLPPVEGGAPLRDCLKSGIPHAELTEIKRNSGDIVRVCSDLRARRGFHPSTTANVSEGRNLVHFEEQRPDQILKRLKALVEGCPKGVDPMRDLQVIVPLNDASEVSRSVCNEMLQGILNPHGESRQGFRNGDRVICGKNSFFQIVETNQDRKDRNQGSDRRTGNYATPSVDGVDLDFVPNGETGIIVKLEEKFMLVRLADPDRTIKVPLFTKKQQQQTTPKSKKKDGDGGQQESASAGDWDLAYAVTAHKSQGAQWPFTITVIDPSGGAKQLCSVEWFITAFSRAQTLGLTIGQAANVDLCCRKSSLAPRKTFLAELIRAGIEKRS